MTQVFVSCADKVYMNCVSLRQFGRRASFGLLSLLCIVSLSWSQSSRSSLINNYDKITDRSVWLQIERDRLGRFLLDGSKAEGLMNRNLTIGAHTEDLQYVINKETGEVVEFSYSSLIQDYKDTYKKWKKKGEGFTDLAFVRWPENGPQRYEYNGEDLQIFYGFPNQPDPVPYLAKLARTIKKLHANPNKEDRQARRALADDLKDFLIIADKSFQLNFDPVKFSGKKDQMVAQFKRGLCSERSTTAQIIGEPPVAYAYKYVKEFYPEFKLSDIFKGCVIEEAATSNAPERAQTESIAGRQTSQVCQRGPQGHQHENINRTVDNAINAVGAQWILSAIHETFPGMNAESFTKKCTMDVWDCSKDYFYPGPPRGDNLVQVCRAYHKRFCSHSSVILQVLEGLDISQPENLPLTSRPARKSPPSPARTESVPSGRSARIWQGDANWNNLGHRLHYFTGRSDRDR